MRVLPTATKATRWFAFVGLACGVLYSFGGLIYDLLTVGLNWGTAMAFGALAGMPILFGVFGFVLGALIASVIVMTRSVADGMRRRKG